MFRILHNKYTVYLHGLFANWRECVIGAGHYCRLRRMAVHENTVLLVEFNPFHGEVLPGVVHYFQELGYEVVAATRYGTWHDSPFIRFARPPKQFCLTIRGMRTLLRSPWSRKFQLIFFNSARIYLEEYRYFWRVTDFIGKNFSQRKNFAMIEHEFTPAGYGDFWNIINEADQACRELRHHTFFLTPINWRRTALPMLNPHFFGEISLNKSFADGKRIFIAVGRVSAANRNFTETLRALAAVDSAVSWEVWVIGSGKDPVNVPDKIAEQVRFLGRLSFAEMYKRLEKAHFFLPMLEPETQHEYLDGCTSGSRQLILGFGILPVIHKDFGRHYGFTEESGFLYDSHELARAVQRALEITEADYRNRQAALLRESRRVAEISLNNLKKQLEETGRK